MDNYQFTKHEHIFLGENLEKEILGDLFLPNGNMEETYPLIVFTHGFKGFKDWGCWDLLGEFFAERGIAFLKFNFSHNGVSKANFLDITDKESFGLNTTEKQLADLNTIFNWTEFGPFCNKFDHDAKVLAGHSLGGAGSLLHAAYDSRVSGLVLLATPISLGALLEKQNVKKWEKDNIVYIENSRTKEKYPMYYDIYKDYLDNKDDYDLEKAAKELDKNALIFHAQDDQVIPVRDARKYYEIMKNAIYIPMVSGGHTFGCKHPWEEKGLPEALEIVADNILEFILE